MTGEPVKPPVNRPDRGLRRKRPRSPSRAAAPTRPKRTRRTREDDIGAPSQTSNLVGLSHVGATDLNASVSQPEASGSTTQKHARKAKGGAPFSMFPPEVRDMLNTLATKIIETSIPRRHELEPRLGDDEAVKLMSFRPEEDWVGYGEKGESIFTLMVDMSDEWGPSCMWCGHRPDLPKWKRTVAHIRECHFSFRPFPCDKLHDASW